MLREALLALAACLLLASVSPPAAGAEATPGQKAYMEGLRSYELGDYPAAAEKLRAALREDPAEGLRKFRYQGLNFEDYLPHFYLGLSLEKLGQAEKALEALRESDRQGAVRGKPGSSRILSSALERIMRATAPPTPLPATPVPAAPTAAPSPVAEVRPQPGPTTPPGPTPQPVIPTAVARQLPKGSPVPVESPGAPAPAVPSGERQAALREGLRAFFRGEYTQAARRLEALGGGVPAARAFLALSLAGSYVLGGAKDAALLERARAEMAAARAAGASFPEPDVIPPKLRQLTGAS